MTDIMKLATDYAQACYHLANHESYDAERAEEARAALQSAIEALQKEVSDLDVLLEECKMDWSGDVTQLKAEHKHAIESLQVECAEHKENAMRNARIAVSIRAERDQLQSKLGDAIQSSAHWQHQCTELQVENERLKEEAKQWQSLSELSLGMAEAHSKERDALQAKLDAMDKGEPVGFVAPHELKDLSEGFPATVVMFRSNKRTVPLYAAPKALAPLTDEQLRQMRTDARASEDCANEYWFMLFARAIEAAHGIGGTP